MELTHAEVRGGSFKLHKTIGSILVPIVGIPLLLVVALNFWHATDLFERLGLLALGGLAANIGVSYFWHQRVLNQLNGQIAGKSLIRLCESANSMAFFGYVICFMGADLLHRTHLLHGLR